MPPTDRLFTANKAPATPSVGHQPAGAPPPKAAPSLSPGRPLASWTKIWPPGAPAAAESSPPGLGHPPSQISKPQIEAHSLGHIQRHRIPRAAQNLRRNLHLLKSILTLHFTKRVHILPSVHRLRNLLATQKQLTRKGRQLGRTHCKNPSSPGTTVLPWPNPSRAISR